MSINYSAHGRDKKLLYFDFDTLREVAIRANVRRIQEHIIKRVSRQACEVEKSHFVIVAETSENKKRDDWVL
jgi:hypothetical protein